MNFTAAQIAGLLDGIIEGSSDVLVNKLAKIEEGTPGSLTFLANEKYLSHVYSTQASVIIVSKTVQFDKPLNAGCTLIRVEDPRMAFTTLLEKYQQIKQKKTGIEQPSYIAPGAVVGNNVYIGAFVYIADGAVIGDNTRLYPNAYIGENVSVGTDCTLHAGVKVYADSVIGNYCTLHAGVVLGGDGFGFAPNSENNYTKMIHSGNAILEDHVEVGANTTIDRATLGSTIIRRGVKLDNLIQVGHNAEIGENTVIAAQSGVAGSAKIGKNCLIGGQVGIVGHISIADDTKIAAQSGIGQTISQPGTVVQGSPAFAIGEYKRSYVMFRNLPKLKTIIDQLEKELNELKQIS